MKKEKINAEVYGGLSGLQVPVPKYKFPPEHQGSSRLTYYSTFFNSIEINSSFYKIPMPATVSKWSASVPDNFKFTFKLFREVTHNKELEFKRSDLETFFKAINSVGPKKGALLLQLPPGTGKEYFQKLRDILDIIKEKDPSGLWRLAVEFRNRSWYHADVYNLLHDYEAALVIQDMPKSSTPSINHTTNFIYLRFHGPSGNYRDSYPESFLYEYAAYIREWLAEKKEVYVYFNNTMGDAFKNLQTLNKFI